jgi:hypothetical protein
MPPNAARLAAHRGGGLTIRRRLTICPTRVLCHHSENVQAAFRETGGQFHRHRQRLHERDANRFPGELMQGRRQSVVMATKYTNAAAGTDPNAAGNHRKGMMQAVEAAATEAPRTSRTANFSNLAPTASLALASPPSRSSRPIAGRNGPRSDPLTTPVPDPQ